MQNIFVAVNYEEESNSIEASENDDVAMMRFEFYEAVIRSSFGKYITSGLMSDASDAIEALISQVRQHNEPITQSSLRAERGGHLPSEGIEASLLRPGSQGRHEAVGVALDVHN